MNKRFINNSLLALFAIGILQLTGLTQDKQPDKHSKEPEITTDIRKSINRGIDWMVKNQNEGPIDVYGSFG